MRKKHLAYVIKSLCSCTMQMARGDRLTLFVQLMRLHLAAYVCTSQIFYFCLRPIRIQFLKHDWPLRASCRTEPIAMEKTGSITIRSARLTLHCVIRSCRLVGNLCKWPCRYSRFLAPRILNKAWILLWKARPIISLLSCVPLQRTLLVASVVLTCERSRLANPGFYWSFCWARVNYFSSVSEMLVCWCADIYKPSNCGAVVGAFLISFTAV